MATVAPSSDQAAELLQNLSLDAQTKSLEIPEPTKKASVYQYGTVDSGISANGQIPQGDRPMTPFLQDLMDPSMLYQHYPSPYYYGGYTGTEGTWDDYSRYSAEGVDMTSGVNADNGSVMYGGYGYASYAPYSPAASPVPTMGNDGQLYGPQQYQYPPYFQPLTPSSGSLAPNQPVSSQAELSMSIPAEHKTLPVEAAKANSAGAISGGVKGNNGSMPYKPKYRNTSLSYNNTYGRGNFSGGVTASGYQDSRYSFDGQYRSTAVNSFSKANNIPSSRNSNYRQNSSYMGLQQTSPISSIGSTHGFVNRVYPNKYYGNYGETFSSGIGYGSSGYDSRINGQGWLPVDSKYKSKGRGNGYYGYRTETDFGLNEMNRGPRGKGPKYPKTYSPITLAVKGQNLQSSETVSHEKDETLVLPDMDQYNRADFSEEYADAKFYIIKSYSEDDVHKSIKYNVWASTPTGNKKLDAAFQEAQQKPGGCPVFLLFSVNASGQFVGLAEMLGPVDFDKNVEYWQQDKWTGCFPVKWHIVKDIPNSMLKHITLENNENKPVTNSRDTQEVKLDHGLRIIKIFKDHVSKTCILDDFEFYEIREKCIQSKKAKQQQFHKHVLDAKTTTDEKKAAVNGLHEALSDASKEPTPTAQANGDLKPLEDPTTVKSGDSASKVNKPVALSDASKEPTPTAQANGDLKPLEDPTTVKSGDSASKVNKPVAFEKKIVANGIANA